MSEKIQRTKMVSVRFTEQEYERLRELRTSLGASSVSDTTRLVVSKAIDGRVNEELSETLKEIHAKIARLQSTFDGLMTRARQHRSETTVAATTQASARSSLGRARREA